MSGGIPAVAAFASVTHRYGATVALDGISVAIPRGSITGLVGPDGVGKSTLLSLLAGARRLQTGTITTLGGDMSDAAHRRAVCSRVAYMPQGLGRNLYPTLCVFENADFAARLFGLSEHEREKRIAELLEATGLAPFTSRPAGQLSGGMKQKLSLCCALVHDPDLLILDEPTTGVDPLSRQQFWKLIARIRARSARMSVVTASAYMEEAMQFDHLVAMDAGRVLAEGTPDELIRHSGASNLEDAFIALLPEEHRAGHVRPTAPPLHTGKGAPAIEAVNLTKRFHNFVAVNDVTVRVGRGEIFGFLGSNGCGKTTTMKMLTGLISPTSGTARLFGRSATADGAEVLQHVGYMSQSFSLYSELSVRHNLELHARLFHLAPERIKPRTEEMLARFGLTHVADARPARLPLGVRQRLQLAVAVIHSPEMLILDEPTSGVDPIARDHFWALLIELSRRDGVTIFISTHYVNEAERCDRISLMHAGRILAMGAPSDLREARGTATLEEAFIGYLEDAARADGSEDASAPTTEMATRTNQTRRPRQCGKRQASLPLLNLGHLWAFARREAVELVRDPVRVAFALVGPLILAVAMTFGISFDTQNLRFAALDEDQSQESRSLLAAFDNSPYFLPRPRALSHEELDRRLVAGDIAFALIIPENFGRDLIARRQPEVALRADGSQTFRAETTYGFVQGAISKHSTELKEYSGGRAPASTETRFLYNQAFLSRNAIGPGVLMMLIMLFSAMLTALGVVREKELGSIINFYVSPVGKLEFLAGKQLPYVAVALISFLALSFLIHVVFGVPMEGSFVALAAGAVLFAIAATAFGLVISTFVNSQIAAIAGSAIIVTIPTLNFSGMLYPVSTLEGSASVISSIFPAYYFQNICTGVFNKGLGISQLYHNHLILIGFCVAFWALAALLLQKQEA